MSSLGVSSTQHSSSTTDVSCLIVASDSTQPTTPTAHQVGNGLGARHNRGRRRDERSQLLVGLDVSHTLKLAIDPGQRDGQQGFRFWLGFQ